MKKVTLTNNKISFIKFNTLPDTADVDGLAAKKIIEKKVC
jgi:hypothetical protein